MITDKIQALLDYANEVSGVHHPTLGEAMRTLTDGLQGGGTTATAIESGILSSRLSALLAYVNERTHSGDKSIGEAIRTLQRLKVNH